MSGMTDSLGSFVLEAAVANAEWLDHRPKLRNRRFADRLIGIDPHSSARVAGNCVCCTSCCWECKSVAALTRTSCRRQ